MQSTLTYSGRRKKAKSKRATVNAAEAPHQRDLPFEIWSLVFSFLSVDDLTRVARVSATFLRICRLRIYQTLNLRNDNDNYAYTFNILHHINELACSVKHVTFFTAWTPWMQGAPTATWLELDVLARFLNLRSLTLIGCPFVVKDEQQKFVEIIGRVCPYLKGFTYVPYYPTALPHPAMEIHGLCNVTWSSYLASSPEPQCISLLLASVFTITSLNFPTCPGYPIIKRASDPDTWVTPDIWADILDLQFPHLVSFSVGLLYPQTISDRRYDTPPLLTKFLMAHPKLEHVSLGCSSQFAHLYEGISGTGDFVTSDFLPALQSFETHPANLAIMLRQRVRSLQTLKRLRLSYYCTHAQDEHSGHVADLLLALQGTPGFPFVQQLGVYFSGEFGGIGPMALQWVHRLGAYFPAVLSWSGHVGVVSPWEISEALAPYNLIKTLDMPYTTLSTMRADGNLSADDFVPIAEACPHLRSMVIKTHIHQTQGVKHIVNRNNDGGLGSVIVNPPKE